MSEGRSSAGTLRASLVTMRIIHGSMCACVGIYLMMLFMLRGRDQAPGGEPVEPSVVTAPAPAREPPSDVFTVVFAAAAAITAGAMLFVRRLLMPPGVREGRTEALAGGTAPDQLSAPARRAVARVLTASIVSWALCESIAVFGLVLAFLHHDIEHYLPFGGAALVLLLVLAPKRAELEAAVRAAPAT
jgi:hypothetical protein